MATLTEAVGTDTYGGLTGFKRTLQGNPTKVPTNLPAFRGAATTPGGEVRAPAIKSSANHPDRKTNVTIPYARLCRADQVREPGSRKPGDVVFASRRAPETGGIGASAGPFYFSRLAGIDQLNSALGESFWKQKRGQVYTNILVDCDTVADDWRQVPTLAEWAVDGVVLSDDQPGTYATSGDRDGQLFNVAVQGPAPTNNGYVDLRGAGLLSESPPNAMPYEGAAFRPHDFGHNGTNGSRDGIAHLYMPLRTHTFPKQMFDRDVHTMSQLYVALVATVHYNPGAEWTLRATNGEAIALDGATDLLSKHDAIKDAMNELREKIQQGGSDVNDHRAALTAKEQELYALLYGNGPNFDDKLGDKQLDEASKAALPRLMQLVLTSRHAWVKMGWWSQPQKGDVGTKQPGAPERSFTTFQYVCVSSDALMSLDAGNGARGTAPLTMSGAYPDGASDRPGDVTKRRRTAVNEFDRFWSADDGERERRQRTLRSIVGAWSIGKVLDTKAQNMPLFTGGPLETGYRLTVDVKVAWTDWRALRRLYTSNPEAPQIAEDTATLGLPVDRTGAIEGYVFGLFSKCAAPWVATISGTTTEFSRSGAIEGYVPDGTGAYRRVRLDAEGSKRAWADNVPRIFAERRDSGRVLYWPTRYNRSLNLSAQTTEQLEELLEEGADTALLAFMDRNTNIPVNPDEFYKGIANEDVDAFSWFAPRVGFTEGYDPSTGQDKALQEPLHDETRDGGERYKRGGEVRTEPYGPSKLNPLPGFEELQTVQTPSLATEPDPSFDPQKWSPAYGHRQRRSYMTTILRGTIEEEEEEEPEPQAQSTTPFAAAPPPPPAPNPRPPPPPAAPVEAAVAAPLAAPVAAPVAESSEMEMDVDAPAVAEVSAPAAPAPPAPRVAAAREAPAASAARRARARAEATTAATAATATPSPAAMDVDAPSPSASPSKPTTFPRRRGTPSPSPDRTETADALGAEATADAAVEGEAEAAAGARRGRRRGGDVFSSIFGGGDTPQPLNPAHRTDGGGSNRAFPRRRGRE